MGPRSLLALVAVASWVYLLWLLVMAVVVFIAPPHTVPHEKRWDQLEKFFYMLIPVAALSGFAVAQVTDNESLPNNKLVAVISLVGVGVAGLTLTSFLKPIPKPKQPEATQNDGNSHTDMDEDPSS